MSLTFNWTAIQEIRRERPKALLSIEANWPHDRIHDWTVANRQWSIYISIVYVIVLFAGRRLMRDRQPFSLRGPLALWNIFMALFSIIVTARLFPYFIKRILMLPLYDQVCFGEYGRNDDWDPPMAIWHDVFVLTKPMEFVDTLFIVLRKQHLHFLHWYHHVTVVILCWYSLGSPILSGNVIVYVALNGFVHSVMYTYYCCRSARIFVPKPLQMSITVLQISQMIGGMFVNSVALYHRLAGHQCEQNDDVMYLALAIYGSYFYLFCKFFYEFYIAPKKSPTAATSKSD